MRVAGILGTAALTEADKQHDGRYDNRNGGGDQSEHQPTAVRGGGTGCARRLLRRPPLRSSPMKIVGLESPRPALPGEDVGIAGAVFVGRDKSELFFRGAAFRWWRGHVAVC